MVALAFSEASGKTWSRTSPRAGEAAEVFGATAEGKVSVRRAAVEVAAAGERSGSSTGFVFATALDGFCVSDFAADFVAGPASVRVGCSTGFGAAAWGA